MPLLLDQCMHCFLEPSGHDSYVLKYEFLNQYIPLLQARKKSRKASSLLTSSYEILPAFKCIPSSSSSCYWASQPFLTQSPEVQLSPQRFSRERSRSLFKQLRSAIRPGHSHGHTTAKVQPCFSLGGSLWRLRARYVRVPKLAHFGTKFYHLWLIMTCQFWFDSRIGTRWILCSIEWLMWHICQLWHKVQCISMLVECDIPILD